MKKSTASIFVALLLSVVITYFSQTPVKTENIQSAFEIVDTGRALFPQKVEKVNNEPVEIIKLYRENQLIGIIHDENRLQEMFDSFYHEEYEEEFPDSKLGFVDDLIQIRELSYNIYEDRDDDIFSYIQEEDLFAIEVPKISFSNGETIFVKDLGDFKKARDAFIQNFVSKETYEALKNQEKLPELNDYGTREVNVEVMVSGQEEKESVKISKGLAPKENILMDENEVLTYLSYGKNPKIETYKVKEFDTLEGIAWHYGMNANQIASINSDQIKNTNQVLETGMELKVSKFNSPFTVRVTKERLESEVVYPKSTIYRSDPKLKEGLEKVDTEEKNGARDVLYEDVYENGESVSTREVNSKITLKPVRGVIRYGTYVEPKVGSGRFRWPMDNAYILCGWGCYPGHKGVDFAAHGGGYGPIYAADRGVVTANGYDPGGWGYYIRIDHGNGYQTLYAHMRAPGYYSVGSTVSKGDNIGYVGMTGRTTYPHVHLELWSGGARINPCSVMGC